MTRKPVRPHSLLRKSALVSASAVLVNALAVPILAMADDAFRYFDLPGQTLQSGLVELALQADITVVANHQLISGYQSASIIGPYTPQQALDKLLSRTPLEYRFDAATDAFVILPKNQESVTESAAQSPPSVDAPLEEVVVYAPTYPFRYNTLTKTQLGDGSATYDDSRFHTVLPSELIEDQMPLEIGDLLRNGSGISPADGRSDTNDDYYMRGFPRHAIYVDGFRVENTTGVRFLPDNIERVEILKGPSTLRYGQGEPGGMVNLVRKKPLDEPITQMQFSVGANGLRKIAADIGDELLENVDYRLNLVHMQQDLSTDIEKSSQQLFAPTLRWRPSATTQLNLSYEYQNAEQQNTEDFELILPIPEENFPGATFDQVVRRAIPEFQAERHLLRISGDHFFSEIGENPWKIKSDFVWQDEDRHGVRGSLDHINSTELFNPLEISNLYLVLIPGGQVAIPVLYRTNPNDPFDPLLSIGSVRSIYDEEAGETGLQSSLAIDGSLATGKMQHHINLGVDWRRQDLYQANTIESRRPLPFQSWPESESPPLSYLFNVIFDPDRPLGNLELFEYRQVSDEYGIYFQNTTDITDKLSVTLGARLSRIEIDRELLSEQQKIDMTPVTQHRLQSGIHYQLTDDLQLFANYAQGLRSNQSKGGFGSAIDEPELSDQWEIGARSYFLEGRLSAAMAVYRINKTNIYSLNSFSLNAFSLEEYGQRVLGADLDLTFQYSSNTQIIGSFSAQDNELTYGLYAGNIPAASTPNTASIFANHIFSDRLSANIGSYYVGHRYADHANSYKIDSFYTVDLGAQYQVAMGALPVTLQLKINNLLDENYYSDVVAGIRLNQGASRQVVAGLKIEL